MDGIGLSHHHMTHVIAVEIEWGAFVEKKDPLRFNVAICNWSCVDNWVSLIFLLFFFDPYESLRRVFPDTEKHDHTNTKGWRKKMFFFFFYKN